MNTNLPPKERLQVIHNHYYRNILFEKPLDPLRKTNVSYQKKSPYYDTVNSTTTTIAGNNTTFSSPKKRMHFSPEPVKQISNFFDKEQINGAIMSLNATSSRIGALDFIIKRRQEIKEAEDQVRLQKAAPVILKLNQNFQNRIKNRINNKGNQFNKVVTDVDSRRGSMASEGPQSSLPYLGGQRTRLLSLKPKGTRKLSHQANDTTQEEPSVDRELQEDPEDKEAAEEREQIMKLKQLTLFIGPKTEVDHKPFNLDTTTRASNGANTKNGKSFPSPRSNKVQMDPNSFHLGQKHLEKELLRYLVKHKNQYEECSVVLEGIGAKERRLKEIESKAKKQFINLQNDEGKTLYFLPCSPKSQKTTVGKGNISGDSLKHLPPSNKEISANRSSGAKGTRSFTLLKKSIDLSSPKDEVIKNEEAEEDAYGLGGFGESFASFTETKLDNLYRENRKLKKTIKVLDWTLDNEQEQTKQKKLQQAIDTRQNDLRSNSTEIMRMVMKKIGM